MKNIFKYVSIHIMFMITLYSSAVAQVNESSTNAFNFATDLLKKGHYIAYQYNLPSPNEEQVATLQKMQASLAIHADWAKNVFKNIQPGTPMPYHENLGITKEEYAKVLIMFKNDKLIKSDSIPLSIMNENATILFKVADHYTILNTLKMDLNKKKIYFDDMELKYKSQISINKNDSKLPEAWDGFSWEYEELPHEGIENLDLNKPFDAKIIKCNMGKLSESKDIFLHLNIIIIEQGQYTVKQEVALVLDPTSNQ